MKIYFTNYKNLHIPVVLDGGKYYLPFTASLSIFGLTSASSKLKTWGDYVKEYPVKITRNDKLVKFIDVKALQSLLWSSNQQNREFSKWLSNKEYVNESK